MKTLRSLLLVFALLSAFLVTAQPATDPEGPALEDIIEQPNPLVHNGVYYHEFANNMYFFPEDLLRYYNDTLASYGIVPGPDTSFVTKSIVIPGHGTVEIGVAQITDPLNNFGPRLFLSEGTILAYTLAAQATLREFDFGPNYTASQFAMFHNEEPPTDSVVNGYYADYMRCRRACMVQYPAFFRDCAERFESDFMVTVCYQTKKFACNKDCPGWHARLVIDRSSRSLPDILH